MAINKERRHLPLWKLEYELAQARRRFEIAEENYRHTERELEQLRAEIKLRRMEEDKRLCITGTK